jgi:hypothetical protein
MTGQSELQFETRPREMVKAGPDTLAAIREIEAAGGVIAFMDRRGNEIWRLRVRWPKRLFSVLVIRQTHFAFHSGTKNVCPPKHLKRPLIINFDS